MFYQTQTLHAGRRKGQKFPILSLVTLTSDLDLQTIQARDQARLPCEFGAYPFIGSRDISYTNKNGAKNRTSRSYCVR